MKKPKLTRDAVLFRKAIVVNRPIAESMLKEWPDLLEERSCAGETALHWWAIEANDNAVQWLLSLGAKVDTQDDSDATPLIHAARLGHLATCKILLSAGANPSATDNNADTALHFASQYGHLEICKLLIDAGANVKSLNSLGESPFDVALPRKREAIQQFFLTVAPPE